MADEYIKREAAKALLRQHEHRFTCADEANGYGNVKWSEYVVYSDTAQNCIDAIPVADVAPVRHGRWIWDNDAIDWGLGAWVCSECHGRNENIHAGKPGYDHTIGMSPYSWAGSAYCPNCGCAMGDA